MQYMGSKNKIAKLILPILNSERKNSTWVEPFVGGANMIDKVSGDRIGNDAHFYLIELLKAVRDGWRPPENITKEEYYKIKENEKDFPPELVGFAGFLCSFGGKWWGGFAKNSKNDNYAARGSRCLIKQSKNLQGVNFLCGSYLDLVIPANSLIYCDRLMMAPQNTLINSIIMNFGNGAENKRKMAIRFLLVSIMPQKISNVCWK
jgi:DNA adenine methylase